MHIVETSIIDIPSRPASKPRKPRDPISGHKSVEIPDIDPRKMEWVTGKLRDAPIVKDDFGN